MNSKACGMVREVAKVPCQKCIGRCGGLWNRVVFVGRSLSGEGTRGVWLGYQRRTLEGLVSDLE